MFAGQGRLWCILVGLLVADHLRIASSYFTNNSVNSCQNSCIIYVCIWFEYFCCLLLFYAIATVFHLYHSGDMMHEMGRRKPEPTFFTDSRDL